jgi:Uma2 family endonuclease
MSTATTQITADDYSRMHFDVPTELVRGEVVFLSGEDGMTRPGFRHGQVCGNVYFALSCWNRRHGLGRLSTNDSWITTHRDPDTVRGADVAYLRKEKLPEGQVPEGPTDIVPDLCVEVLSPSNTVAQMREKADEYLVAGIEEVWIVDPKKQSVQVLRSDGPPRLLNARDELTSSVLPGFAVQVSEFFEDV